LDAFPWAVTHVTKDDKKKSFTLRTKRKELIVYANNSTDFEGIWKEVNMHSLEIHFQQEYGIISYIGQVSLGRYFLCEHRDTFTYHLVLMIPIKKFEKTYNSSLIKQIVKKLALEISRSFELDSITGLVKVTKISISETSLNLIYTYDSYAIPLESLMNFDEIRRDDIITAIDAVTKTVIAFYEACPRSLLEVSPKTMLISRVQNTLRYTAKSLL